MQILSAPPRSSRAAFSSIMTNVPDIFTSHAVIRFISFVFFGQLSTQLLHCMQEKGLIAQVCAFLSTVMAPVGHFIWQSPQRMQTSMSFST